MAKKLNYESSYSLELVQNIVNEVPVVLKVRSGIWAEIPILEAFLIISSLISLIVGEIYIFCSQSFRGTFLGLITADARGYLILATTVVALASIICIIAHYANKIAFRLEEKRLYNLAQQRQQAIINKIGTTPTNAKEQEEYLYGLNILLQQAIKKLKEDLD